MTDHIETIQGATVQHGPKSGRVFMKELGQADPARLIPKLAELAVRNNYPKVFVKVPASESRTFYRSDYRKEAAIPDFYDGEEDAVFLSNLSGSLPREEPGQNQLDEIMITAREYQNSGLAHPLPQGAVIRKCCGEDVPAMARMYRMLLPAYPFAVHDIDYLLQSMADESHYYRVEIRNEPVALAAAVVDTETGSAEMTHFVTHPDWRKNGLSARLIQTMENAMRHFDIQTVYAMARASSAGINIAFARLGYSYGGRLINKTRISGHTESMNVWHRNLQFTPS
ncbi:putative beta-lysine N-acetyltransferase [Pontiella agarivorans]|uniref:Beta-lysine N-acetyltransferase n=1 Tax=Pontiella agarivorans TaxID=3038953 RepID=A0ABU5MU44_9BACT|nr:putative beta-lysine N-acetyltransferase [Pontiella agarivorans]MDZ8117658.1 putative beta-lysine N-acetyltransferase [Pontiella agarivorans]